MQNARLYSPQIKKVPPIQRHPPRHPLILLELPPWTSGVAIGGDARQQISPHLDHGLLKFWFPAKRFFPFKVEKPTAERKGREELSIRG